MKWAESKQIQENPSELIAANAFHSLLSQHQDKIGVLESCILESNCRTLKLDSLELTKVDFRLIDASRVIKLDLSHNCLAKLHKTVFHELINLEELDLSYNRSLSDLARQFENLIKLKHLYLMKCGFVSLDKEYFYGLRSLITLDLSGNFLKEIYTLHSNTFDSLNSLLHLNLEDSIIKHTKELYYNLSNLCTLKLSTASSMTNLDFSYLKNLEDLNIDLSRCKIKSKIFNTIVLKTPPFLITLRVNLNANNLEYLFCDETCSSLLMLKNLYIENSLKYFINKSTNISFIRSHRIISNL
jgi:hypothetical protein